MALSLHNFRLNREADRFGPTRLLVVEIDQGATRLVSVSRQGDALHWEASRSLPRVDEKFEIGHQGLDTFLKKEEQANARYASVVFNDPGALVRLLNFNGQPGRSEVVAREVRQTLGVDDQYEVRHRVIRRSQEGEGQNSEYAVLASAVKREKVDRLRTIITSAGLVPVSLVTHGVATANLAESSVDLMTNDKAVGFLRVGEENSMLTLYVGENLALARQFKTGYSSLLETVMKDYGLDQETAVKFVASGSFDFSGNLGSAAKSWMHQVSISLDFIERRYGQRVQELSLLAAGDCVKALTSAFAAAVGRNVKAWNALGSLALKSRPDDDSGKDQSYAVAICEAQRIMQEGLNANA